MRDETPMLPVTSLSISSSVKAPSKQRKGIPSGGMPFLYFKYVFLFVCAMHQGVCSYAWYQPFTAPMVMPLAKFFWNNKKMVTMGSAPRAAPAMMTP